VSGHSHTKVNTTVNGIPLVQARLSGRAVEIVDLFTSGAPAHREVREVYTDSIAADPDAASIVAAAKRRVDQIAPQMNRPVATIAKTMVNTQNTQRPLGNLIADAMRVVGGGDVAVINNGGIREVLHAGVATYGTLFEVLPFGNSLVRVRVRGSALRAYFDRALSQPGLVAGMPDMHVSGARIVYHAGPSQVIDTITVLGRPLQDQEIYTVVINNFMASGGDHFDFGNAALTTAPASTGQLEALVAYLASLPQPVTEPAEPRLIRKP
jgi:5'-nucleotidase